MRLTIRPVLAVFMLTAACSNTNPGAGVAAVDASISTVNEDGGVHQSGDGGMGGTSSGGSSSGEASSSSSGGMSTSASASGGEASSSSSGATSSSSAASSSSSSSSGGSSSSSGGMASCQSSRDCELGQICSANVCIAGCTSGSDCPQIAPQCDTSVMPNGACVQCVMASDCPFNDAVCDQGTCRLPCGGMDQCPPPYVCRTTDDLCVRCIEDAQCGDGRICEANACVEGCRGDASCGDGEICQNAQCVEGCRASPNTCPAGSVCRTDVGSNGVCESGCNVASDCGDGMQFTCQGGQCVQSCTNDGDCDEGSVCTNGACVAGCRLPERNCDRGEYCSAPMGTAGQCLTGCDTNEDCAFQREDICDVASHSCVECTTNDQCNFFGLAQGTCTMNNTCVFTCDPNAFDTCRALGFFCDDNTSTCVECTADDDCDEFEGCMNNRCVDLPARPLCAPCESDDQCGDANDLCVTHTLANRTERVCGVDCSNGQMCPAGTSCQQVGGVNGAPVRGHQCLPANSVHEATCAARSDLINEEECFDSRQCGMLGGANSQGTGDAICSGAGASDGLCSVFCTVGGNDCPSGFFCEDPPDTPQREFAPRCAPNP